MQCSKCGANNVKGSKYCPNCGTFLPEESSTTTGSSPAVEVPAQVQPTRTSGMAVASLVLGIVGLMVNFFGILAIIFGAIGMSQTSRDPGLGGRGMAIAGLVLGIVAVGLWILVIALISSLFWFYS